MRKQPSQQTAAHPPAAYNATNVAASSGNVKRSNQTIIELSSRSAGGGARPRNPARRGPQLQNRRGAATLEKPSEVRAPEAVARRVRIELAVRMRVMRAVRAHPRDRPSLSGQHAAKQMKEQQRRACLERAMGELPVIAGADADDAEELPRDERGDQPADAEEPHDRDGRAGVQKRDEKNDDELPRPHGYHYDHMRIPGGLNVALSFVAAAAACALLWLVSHADSLLVCLLGAVAFSYVNNTLFALLHESVHGVFHRAERVNDAFGRWLAAFFPTSFTLQRYFHLGHHRRNRSEAERFDYIAPGENRLLKTIEWYGILTGFFWLCPPLACVLFFVGALRAEHAPWSRQTGFDGMVDGLERLPGLPIRLEILFAALWQLALFRALHLTWSGWLLCYAAFAINWSSLQYADHAWSPLDAARGAWNLRVNPVVRALFLNYHHHRVHHENPKVPWVHLPRFVDGAEPRPSFLRIYLSMWRGPRRLGDAR